MKSLSTFLADYGVSHQNKTNQIIHKICVPLIYFSVVAVVWSIPFPEHLSLPYLNNWFYLIIVPVMIFYGLLGVKSFVMMALFSIVCVAAVIWIEENLTGWLLEVGIIAFVVGWIFQFIGHKIEGAKPSFFQDILFLLIGPLWVFKRFLDKNN